MKSLVLLAVLGVCSAVPFIMDTPEVQAEKARFFQAYRAAQAAANPQQAALFQAPEPVQTRWTGPVAATIPAGVDGTITQVADTAEVSAARNAFLNAYRAQLAATVGAVPSVQAPAPVFAPAPAPAPTFNTIPAAPAPQAKWTGPFAATIPAGLPGSAAQVADTAEVAAAKQVFFNAYQRQAAAAAAPSAQFF